MNTLTKNDATLVDYYEAFENLFKSVRSDVNNYCTHFGLLENPSNEYCFFSMVGDPNKNAHMLPEGNRAMELMHNRIFPNPLSEMCVLDVGFGAGGTIKELAEHNPSSQIHGINLNPVQYGIASEYLAGHNNTQLHFGNIYDYDFDCQFDVIYFIESAFHMRDKEQLIRKISKLLKPKGQLYIVDIFYNESLWQRMQRKPTQEQIFDYLPLMQWEELLHKNNIRFCDFEDLSENVANYLKTNISEEGFLQEIVAPILVDDPKRDALTKHLQHAFRGYNKLARSFRKQMLYYGILRAEKEA